MRYTPKLPKEGINTPKENFLFSLFKLILSLVVSIIVFYIIITIAINITISYLPNSYEKKLVYFIRNHMNFKKYEQNRYLQNIVNKMQKCSQIPYKVKIYTEETGKINAFALPSGEILITSALLKKMKNENELAFVVGHELGHLKHRDNFKDFTKALIFSSISLFLGDEYRQILYSTLDITKSRYSQSQELNADRFGVDEVACAYGGVNGVNLFFESMKKKDSWVHILSDHPDFAKRIQEIKKHIRAKNFNTKNALLPISTH